jgi:hypothetical protein
VFIFPQKAFLGRPLPKSKIYQFASPTPAVKQLFVSQIDSIVWQYKLSPETINLPATESVTEIQIFDISLKASECDLSVLHCIDAAIPFNIFYRLFNGDSVRLTTTFKRQSESSNEKLVIERYFSSNWLPVDSPCEPLPIALNLQSLYEQMLQALLPSSQRPAESLNDQVSRLGELQKKQTELQKLESRLQKEKQFNRKVEINAKIRILKTAISQLEI